MPRLSAKARRAGATCVRRCPGPGFFSVGFTLDGDDSDAPGNGPAVVAALVAKYGAERVQWAGRQGGAIILDLN